ncbi:MAG: hypothetical protein ACLP5H_01595 [Desulfomonilaceae bacterium]
MKMLILDGWQIEVRVPRMCEAHPCMDEPDGTSVAPSRPALNGHAEQEIALDAGNDGGLPSETENLPLPSQQYQ